MNVVQVISAIKAELPNAVIIPMDEDYAIPTRNWILGPFSRAIDANLSRLGLSGWRSSSWDCDKFVRLAWFTAAVIHARTAPESKQGYAIGWMIYMRENGDANPPSPHSINLAVLRASRLLYYEPQAKAEIRLQAPEKDSCTVVVI